MIGIVSTMAACGETKPSHKEADQPKSVPAASTQASGLPRPAADFAQNRRVRLTAATFGIWGAKHPEPTRDAQLTGKNKYLLVVDDGRYNFPANSNPDTDQPTGLYSEPTQKSQPVTKVRDGTELKVVGWTDKGQPVSDAHGGSGYPIWEEVEGRDGTQAWAPWVNVGYTALSELHKLPKVSVGM